MVAHSGMSRKAKFKAALVEAGMTASAWAKNVGGVSRTQLQRTLNNPQQSAPLTEKIDAFIEQHFDKAAA